MSCSSRETAVAEPALIAAVGLSHQTAPLALRERYAVSAETLPLALRELHARCGAAVLLISSVMGVLVDGRNKGFQRNSLNRWQRARISVSARRLRVHFCSTETPE